MEQKTEASQAVDEREQFVQVYLQEYPGGNAYDAEIAYGGYAGTMWLAAKRATLKAQPAPTEAELARQAGELHAYYMSGTTPDDLADNLYRAGFNDCRNGREYDPASSPAWGEVKSAIEVTTEAAQGNTSNNSSSSQLSGNSGELANKQVLENIEQVQGEDSARLEWIFSVMTLAQFCDATGFDVPFGVPTRSLRNLGDWARKEIDRARASAETGGVKP